MVASVVNPGTARRETSRGAPGRTAQGGTAHVSTVLFHLPTPEGDTAEWWEAAKEARLLIRHCLHCGDSSYYPRPLCSQLLE